MKRIAEVADGDYSAELPKTRQMCDVAK